MKELTMSRHTKQKFQERFITDKALLKNNAVEVSDYDDTGRIIKTMFYPLPPFDYCVIYKIGDDCSACPIFYTTEQICIKWIYSKLKEKGETPKFFLKLDGFYYAPEDEADVLRQMKILRQMIETEIKEGKEI